MSAVIQIESGGRVEVATGAKLDVGEVVEPSLPDIEPDYAWWDFSDITTLFQDSTLLTPVTTDDDRVGGVTDKTGNGRTIIQTGASSRPTYKAGAAESGIDLITTVGSDWLEISSGNFGTVSTPHTIIGIARTNPNAPPELYSRRLWGGTSGGTGNVHAGVGPNTGPTFNGGYLWGSGGSTPSVLFPTFASHGGNTWNVWSMRSDATMNTYIDNVFDLNRAANDLSKGFRVGHDSNLGTNQGAWESLIGEIRVYDYELTVIQQTTVYDFLVDKWGI